MFSSSNVGYFSLLIFTIIMILLFTLVVKGKNITLKTLIVAIPILILASIYIFDEPVHFFIASNIFPDRICNLENSSIKETGDNIKLPPNSVFLIRTPAKIYYSKGTCDQCKDFFNKTLYKEKNNNQIKDYFYDSINKKFIVNLNNNENFEITFLGDSDYDRYGISTVK